jgi:pimeloyl-ACP methyl ester carboxylesterase
LTEHRVEFDGRVLCVLESGAPDGPAVFALHGTPGSRTQWRGLVEDAEERGVRLLTYDRPGYGGSDPAPGRCVAGAARDIAAIADALDIDRFAVHGGSGGGPHALACAALLAARTVAVASLAGVAPWNAGGLDWLGGMGQDNLDEFGAILEGRTALEAYLREQADEMLASHPEEIAASLLSLLGPPDRAVLNGEVAEFLHEATRVGIEERIDGWVDDDFAFVAGWGFDVEEIAVPVQVWHGAQDQFVPVSHGRWLAERIPGAEAHISDDDAHLTIQLSRIGEVHAWLLGHF